MPTEQSIPANEFCAVHHIEVSFIHALQESGLIEIVTVEEKGFIHAGQLQQLEKIIRLFYEMDINLEGIETVTYLLQKINGMQDEITRLKNRLRFYERNE